MTLCRRLFFSMLGLLSVAGAGTAYAQLQVLPNLIESAPEETAPPLETAPAGVISIEEIASRTRLVETQIRFIRAFGRPTPEVRRVETEFSELGEALHILREDPDRALPPKMTLQGVEDVANEWRTVQTKLDDYAQVLTKRTQELESKLRDLRTLHDLWERTRASTTEPLPPTLVKRIESILSAIREAENFLRTQRDSVLTLADQVVQDQVRVLDLLDRVDQVRASLRRNLLVSDSPPLWRAFERDLTRDPIGAQGLQAARIHIETLTRFVELHFTRILLHVLGTALLAIFLIRKRFRWLQRGGETKALDQLLNHPLSIATLIGIFLTRTLYPRAPQVVFELNVAIGLVPGLRLVSPLIVPQLRKPLYALVALFLFSHVRDLIETKTLLHQIALLAETSLSLAVILFTWLQLGYRQDRHSLFYRVLRTAVALAAAALVSSLLLNIVGKVSFAAMLTSATLATGVIGLGLRATALIFTETWAWFLRAPAGRSLFGAGPDVERTRQHGIRWIHLTLGWIWVLVALIKFQLFRACWNAARAFFAARLRIGSFEISLGELIGFFALIWASQLLARLIRVVLEDHLLPKLPLKRGVPRMVSTMAQYAVVLLGFFAALGAAGVDFSRFTVLAGAFGIGLAFGLQNIVNNFVSGLILLFERPIQLGDTVEIGTITGNVQRIGIRSSTVRTGEGAEVIVPNADLISKEVTNWTLSDRNRRMDIPVGVAYGSDPQRVIEILRQAALQHAGVLREPAPMVLFTALGESSLDFLLSFWTNRFDTHTQVRSEVLLAAYAALREVGIEIPFPQRDVHLHNAS